MMTNLSTTRNEPVRGAPASVEERNVRISPIGLSGILRHPAGANALIVFAHGSGSSRLSPLDSAVAEGLNAHGMAMPLFDLFTLKEEATRVNVFDIRLLANRVIAAVDWIVNQPSLRLLRCEYGSGGGACRCSRSL